MEAPKGLSRKRVRAHRAEHAGVRRDVLAIAAVYAGTIAWLFALIRLDEGSTPDAATSLLLLTAPALIGVVAVRLLGKGAFAATLAGRPDARGVLLAFPAAAAMLLGGVLLVTLLALALGASIDFKLRAPSLGTVVVLAVLPALFEEWLCRGVLWTACSRLTTTSRTIAATALLFAMLHVPAWSILHVPRIAFLGVVLGMLRARTGSLVPCVLAHFLNNAVAAAAMSD